MKCMPGAPARTDSTCPSLGLPVSLGFSRFYGYIEEGSWGSVWSSVPDSRGAIQGLGCWVQTIQLLAGFQATSILSQLCPLEATLPYLCPLTDAITMQSSRLPPQARPPGRGSLHSICKPRWRVCFLAGRAILGHWVKLLSGSDLLSFSFLFFVVFETLK